MNEDLIYLGGIEPIERDKMLTEKQHQEWKEDLIKLHELETKNREYKVTLQNSFAALPKDPLFAKACIEKALEEKPKLCICCEKITEENAHLHRNCGK